MITHCVAFLIVPGELVGHRSVAMTAALNTVCSAVRTPPSRRTSSALVFPPQHFRDSCARQADSRKLLQLLYGCRPR